MAEDLPTPEPKPRRRSSRGILRWLVRAFVRSTAAGGVAVLLLAILASVLYLNRVRLLNQALDFLVAPFRVTVDEIAFLPLGSVRVTNLRLAPKSAPPGSLLASIPEAHLTYRIAELRRTRRFENLTLRGASVVVDDVLLASLTAPRAEPGDVPAREPFLLSRLALFTGTLAVEDSHFLVDLESLPKIQGGWSFRSGSFDFEESGLSRTPFAWQLSDLAIGPDGRDGRIAAFSGEGRVSADLRRFEFGPLRLEHPVLRLTPQTFPRRTKPPTEEGAPPRPGPSDPPPARSIHLQGVEVAGAELSIEGFDGADGGPLLPDFSFGTSFSLPAIAFAEGGWKGDAPLALTLREARVGAGGPPFLSAASIQVEAQSLGALVAERRLSKVVFETPDLLASNGTLARFLGSKAEAQGEDDHEDKDEDKDEAEAATPDADASPWVFETVEILPGSVRIRDLDLGGKRAPEFSTTIRGTLRDLRFGGGAGFASEGLQSLLLEQTRLRPPGAAASAEPLLSMERVELEGNWADFQRENLVERLVVRGPRIEFTDAALGDWLRGGDPAPGAPRPINRPVYKARHLEASGGRLVADSSFATGRVPKIHADFSLATAPPREGDPFAYRLQLDEFAIRNHARLLEPVGPPRPAEQDPTDAISPLAEGEVFRVKRIEVDFTAAGLQRTRRIDKLKIDGAVLTVGEGLKAIAGDGAPEAPSDAPDPAPNAAAPLPASPTRDLPAWTLGEVEITRSRVHFESLIPQVEGLQFAIETKLTELPLSLDGILAQEAKQKIELAGIVIKDPYDSFITVAELPTIFVEFSLAGLARQEVDQIDLIGPSLHVGQGLFWWVDYQRRFREQNEGASIGIETDAAARKPDWIIKTINASAGKIVISPTGVPIGVVPFPFNATTNMSGGDIELKLNIPDEEHLYRFPDYKVELEGLAGDVQFNVPVKDLNNNLVQTFTLRRAKWKDFDARDLYITATFDENGIYGNFGGEAYAGYAEGGFNFYLTDRGKWDAWIAGTDLDTGPVTKILVPDSFLMDGKVSLKIVSEGRDKTVGETTGEFQTTTPGWFDITKLDSVFEKLPPEWNSLQRSLTELSLVALKRFDYDKGAGSLYFLNRAGTLELRFVGDYGSRELNLHVHDRRRPGPSEDANAPGTPSDVPATPPAAALPPADDAELANLKSR